MLKRLVIFLKASQGFFIEVHFLKSKQDNNNLLNCYLLFDVMGNSDKCIQNEHDFCDGIIRRVINGSDSTEICACQCHDSSYQLVKRMFGAINQNDQKTQ